MTKMLFHAKGLLQVLSVRILSSQTALYVTYDRFSGVGALHAGNSG